MSKNEKKGTKNKRAPDGGGWPTSRSMQKSVRLKSQQDSLQLTVHKIKEHEIEQNEIVID